MSEEGELTKASKLFQTIGFIIVVTGAIMLLLSFYLNPTQFFGIPQEISAIISGALLSVGFILMMAGIFVMSFLGTRKLVIKRETFSILKCSSPSSCEEIIIRDFKKGDHVFKELDETCIQCNQPYYISAIVHTPLKKPPKPPDYEKFRVGKFKQRKKYRTETVIGCLNHECDEKISRAHEESDYIFKPVEQTCSQCGQQMKILEISDHILKESEPLVKKEAKYAKIKSIPIKKPKHQRVSRTVLACTSEKHCSFETTREFQEGDYMMKQLQETCEKCGAPLMIKQVVEVLQNKKHAEKPPKIKSKVIKRKIEHETQVQVHCENTECNFSQIREFKEGDYIYKIEDEKCNKCGSSLIVFRIFDTKLEKPLKTKLRPTSVPSESST
ncbi:MAG: hypothetical protein ACTSRW_12085 [Candidatus Helarchaeota archaeon]